MKEEHVNVSKVSSTLHFTIKPQQYPITLYVLTPCKMQMHHRMWDENRPEDLKFLHRRGSLRAGRGLRGEKRPRIGANGNDTSLFFSLRWVSRAIETLVCDFSRFETRSIDSSLRINNPPVFYGMSFRFEAKLLFFIEL